MFNQEKNNDNIQIDTNSEGEVVVTLLSNEEKKVAESHDNMIEELRKQTSEKRKELENSEGV